MKSMRVFAAAALLAASCLVPQASSATNLNEPPFYSQLRECFKSSENYGSAFLRSCVNAVCVTSKPCVEEFCRMAGRTGADFTACVRDGVEGSIR